MLFRPTFCANCGEKIARTHWSVFTSRRFCQVCESEYKGQDLIPRAIVIGGVILGVFGFGSYLRSGTPSEHVMASFTRKPAEGNKLPSAVAEKPAAERHSDEANADAR